MEAKMLIDEPDESELPRGSRKIYHAEIHGDIIRVRYKKTIKDKFVTRDVYKQDSEREPDSYFMRMLANKLKLDLTDESFKITEIIKLKYIGFSLPNVK